MIFEDEPDVATMLARLVSSLNGYRVECFIGREQIVEAIENVAMADLVITDLMMPDLDGFEVIERIRNVDSDLPIIVVSAYSTIENAVQAIKAGAFDFLSKPFSPQSVDLVLAKLKRDQTLRHRANELCRRAHKQDPLLHAIRGQSPQMHELRDWICKIRGTGANTLIEGESGTGKELVARAIHADRGPFIAVNMAAIPDELAESELFGVTAGAFTGATRNRPGLIAQADGGVLFLDEIEAASPAIQAKLLRVLEDRKIRPVGSTREVEVDFRLLSASNQHLAELVEKGEFRADLYFRLKVLTVTVPPLRHRKEDIEILAISFLHQYCRAHNRRARHITSDVMDALLQAEWPGNVRELENLIEQAVILCPPGQSDITVDLLRLNFVAIPRQRPVRHLLSVQCHSVRSKTGTSNVCCARPAATSPPLLVFWKSIIRPCYAGLQQ